VANQPEGVKLEKAFKKGCLLFYCLMVLGFIGIFLWGAIVKYQKSINREKEYAALRSSGPENVVKRFIWQKNHSNKIKIYIIDPEIRNTNKSAELESFGEYEGKHI
jgi:hypothetical protein